ncbi:MAG: alpha/beta hydrolase [Burkholderiales bacterium]|nr:alpha/beta hydrolase [Burkholderiales bacterium]
MALHRAPQRCLPTALKASRVLAFLLGAGLLGACALVPLGPAAGPSIAPAQEPASAFRMRLLPGQGVVTLQVLERPALAPPLRYRVVVVPGSGCAGLGPFADRYFAGLLHAQVLVLHKPGVHPMDRTAPGQCPQAFVQTDAHATWRAHAQAALQAWQAGLAQDALPTVLVGVSEGGELLPHLAPQVPRLAGLVLLGASGLDPRETLTLQAQRLGAQAALHALEQAQASDASDTATHQGRSLRYWRELWHWPVQAPLWASPWPLLQVWGTEDALVPAQAYERFARQAQGRAAPYCARALPGADHGLQAPGRDGVQQVWAWLEQWAREPAAGLCAPLEHGCGDGAGGSVQEPVPLVVQRP